MQTNYQKPIVRIEAETNKANRTIDSLHRFQLPTERYTKRLDSLNSLRQTAEAKLSSRLNALKAKTTDKLNALDLPPEFQEPLQKLTKSVNDLRINSDVVKIPELKIPGYTLPEFEGLGDLTSKAADIGQIGNIDKLPDIDTPVGDLGQITQHAKDYQEDLKNITNGNLDDVQALPETIEQQATKIEGMDELQRQSGVIDQLQKPSFRI